MSPASKQYPVLITKEADTDWNVVFPDLPGCVTAGRSVDEALAFAEEALALHVQGMREDGEALPTPSNLEALMADPEIEVPGRCCPPRPRQPLCGHSPLNAIYLIDTIGDPDLVAQKSDSGSEIFEVTEKDVA